MSSLLYALGRRCFSAWKATFAIWFAIVAILGLAALGLGKGPKDVFRIPGVETFTALEMLQHRFPEITGANAQVLVMTKDGQKVTDPEVRERIEATAEELKKVDQTSMILDPWDPLLSTKDTIAEDGETSVINVQMNTSVEMITNDTRDQLVAVAEAASDDEVEFKAGGGAWGPAPPVIGISEAIGVVIAIIVLAFTFRSLLAAGLPLISAGAGLAISLGVIWTATHWLTITSTGPFLALMGGLAVGLDYALFILARYRDELADGIEPEEAAGRSVATAGSAVIFAGVTVMIAMFGIIVTQIPFLFVMGFCGALAVATAVIASITLTPAMFGLLGHRMTPRVTKPTKSGKAKVTLNERWLNLVLRFPKTAILVVSAILIALTIPVLHMKTALPDNGTAHHGTTQKEVYDLVSEKQGIGYNSQIVMAADLIPTREPFEVIDGIKEMIFDLDNVKSIPIATPNPPDGDTMVIQIIPFTGPNDEKTTQLVQDLRDLAPAIEKKYGIETEITGMTAAGVDISDRLSKAVIPYAIFVLGLSLVLLMLVFRSIAVPIKATVNFILSLGASFGVVVLVFQDGFLAEQLNVASVGPLCCFLPIMLTGMLFGLSVDYEVFLIARMREEYVHGATPEEAIRRGYISSTRVITAAAVIMIAVFAAFFPHGDAVTQPIAFVLAVGVFIDAFMVRITLLPAVMILLGDKAWWMPKWMDKRLPVIDVEGEGMVNQIHLADWPAPDAHKGVHAERIAVRDRDGNAVLEPVSLEVAPGGLTLVTGDTAKARTALGLALAGRFRITEGKLKIAGYVLPEQAMLMRPAAALVRLQDSVGEGVAPVDPVDAVRRSVSRRTQVLVVDGLDAVPSLEARNAVLVEVAQQAHTAGLAALVLVSAEALAALDLRDPAVRLLDLDTREVTALRTPVHA